MGILRQPARRGIAGRRCDLTRIAPKAASLCANRRCASGEIISGGLPCRERDSRLPWHLCGCRRLWRAGKVTHRSKRSKK